MKTNAEKDFSKFVLVVDDEEENRELLGRILGDTYEVVYASDGIEALEMIRSFYDMLSLVLLDIRMPNKDGYQVLEDIAEEPKLQKIPVVVLTSDREAEIKSLKLGAADFLAQPYDQPELILARVRHSIDLYENANLIHATETDSLTELYNREFFFEYCEQYKRHHPDACMDAIVININRFHLINAMYGRNYGDKVLKAVSKRLHLAVLILGGMACRHDADTFYLYIPHIDDYDELYQSVLMGIADILKDADLRVRMGIYPDVSKDNTVEDNFSWALQVCNKMRSQAGGGYSFFDDSMHQKLMREATLVDEFEEALSNDQFEVYYQPKYSILGDSPVFCSAEALARWNHPEFGMIDPNEFVPIFEENGLIRRLDRYIWNEVGKQIREWHDKTGVYIPVSVNVSRIDIYDSDVTDYLEDIVRRYDIPDGKYLLEITESAYTDNSDRIIAVVNKLRGMGFRVEMDDFGTGYSSLNMLYALPVDVLKIDKSFLKNIATDERARKMVEFIIDIAKFLQMPIVAEGVEEHTEYEILKKMGCDVIQGYYFSEPLHAFDMTKLIGEKKNEIELA